VTQDPRRKVTIKSLMDKKAAGERIAALAVYDSVCAQLADEVGFDLLVVGVAGPMSYFGHKDPSTVRFEEQLFMCQAVSRVADYGFIVVDMSWGTYATVESAVDHARRLIAVGGADAVKLEGNRFQGPIVEALTAAGIPVMGHLGLLAAHRTEQSGYGVKGRHAEEAAEIVEAARAYVAAGAFAFMLEAVPVEITAYLTETMPVPVVSLGSGPDADGIFHIASDVLGFGVFPMPPRRQRYAHLVPIIQDAFRQYRDEVVARVHPDPEAAFHMSEEEHERFLAQVGPGDRDGWAVSTYYGRATPLSESYSAAGT